MKTTPPATITRTDSRLGRFYDIPNADGTTTKMPSVTTILTAVAKPALVHWAAGEERTAVSEAAADVYGEACRGPQLPRSMFLLALEQRLGATKAHTKALRAAGDIGTEVHAQIQWRLHQRLGVAVGDAPAISAPAKLAYDAWRAWATAVRLRPRFIEQVVYSRTHEYAGTMDLVATLDAAALLRQLEQQGPVATALGDWLRARVDVTALVDFKTGKAIYSESHLQSAAYQRALAEMGHGRVDGGLIVRLPKLATDPGFEVGVVPPASSLFPTFLATRVLWQFQYGEEQRYQARRRKTA